MLFFYLFFIIVIIQRLVELLIARKNETWMKKQGALEYGQKHYTFMVMIHACFFLSLFAEVIMTKRPFLSNWWIFFGLFLVTQFARVWVIKSLGRFWNTKIIVLQNAKLVAKGPYKYINHPNYLIVTLELIIIPLMFQAYYTLICFFILNQCILAIRIPFEERILAAQTDYHKLLHHQNRFLPKIKK